MSEKEKNLLEQAKAGNIEAFEELISGYQKKVFNIAYKIVGNYDDANEMAQEAFIKIFRSIGGFKEEATFSTWVYRITTNVCLDEIRKRKKLKVISLDEDIKTEDGEIKIQVEDEKNTPEKISERNEVRRALNEGIRALSKEHRLMIVMRDIQGFSYEEIGRIVDCPPGTVKSRINRARQALKELLKSNRELFKEESVK